MNIEHIPEEDLEEALRLYREALEAALTTFDVDADRDEIIAAARRELGEDEPEMLDLIAQVGDSDAGDAVWQLEEELVDDRLDSDFDAHHPHLEENADY